MTAHSVFSASGAHRWLTCPGSLALSQGTPRTSNTAANRGTAGHDIAAKCLEHDAHEPDEWLDRVLTVEGEDITIDDDLVEQVTKYVEYVRGISGVRLIEVRSLYAPVLGLEDDEAFGTADAVIIQPDGTLYVIDLKTGRRWVQAQGNKQLLLYAAGVVASLRAVGETIERIRLRIVQPTVHSEPSEWDLTAEEFDAEVATLREGAQEASQALFAYVPGREQDEAWVERYLRPDEDACQWCPAAAFCPKLSALADECAPSGTDEFDLSNHLEQFASEDINEAMDKVPLLDIWIGAVRAEMHRRATRGDEGLNHKLVLGRAGNRRWQNADDARETVLAEGLEPAAVMTEPELLSPAKLEKVLKKLKARNALDKLDDLITRNPPRPTLVPADDPREQWSEGAVENEFGVVENA